MPANDALPNDPPPQHFDLTVQPESARQPWRAQLLTDAGGRIEFASPIELLRHLAQLGAPIRPPGQLK